jgi:FlaG/FlaF family flagellin (archaellin)
MDYGGGSRNRKGISTFIAVLLLIVLAVAAGVLIYAYTMGYLGNISLEKNEGALMIVSVAQHDGGLHLYAKNVGKDSVSFDPTDGHTRVYVNDEDWGNTGGLFTTDPTIVPEGVTTDIRISGFDPTWIGRTARIKIVTVSGAFTETNVKITEGSVTAGGLFKLTVTTLGNGFGTVTQDPLSDNYLPGTVVTLTANPADGSSFVSWGVDASGTDETFIITMDGNKDVTATFTQNPSNYYTLSTVLSGTGSGSFSLNPSGGSYLSGTVVTVTPTAGASSDFSGWTVDSAGTGTPVRTVTMSSDQTVTGVFTLKTVTLTVTFGGSGTGKVNDGSADHTTSFTKTYSYGATATLTPTADASSDFSGWSGPGSGNSPRTIQMNGDQSVTATFNLKGGLLLTINYGGNGHGTVTTDKSPPYNYGDIVHLTPNADASSDFSSWTVDSAGTGSPVRTVTMTISQSVTATFTLKTFTLSVVFAGVGTGKVNDGSADHTAAYQQTYDYGTVVTLTPTADASSDFTSWGGDGSGSPVRTVTMNSDRNVEATFTPKAVTLTVTFGGSGTGKVNDGSADHTTSFTKTYSYGATATLTPTADASSDFSGWTGPGSGNSPRTIQMNGDQSITATFTLKGSTIITLRPNAVGTTGITERQGDTVNWRCVDEASADTSTYVYMPPPIWPFGTFQTDTYNLEDTTQTGTITNVKVYIRCSETNTILGSQARTTMRVGGGPIQLGTTTINLGTAWTTYSSDYSKAPGGANWTWDDINQLQAGVSLQSRGYFGVITTTARCTQVWVEVTVG